ncbi:MAG: 30S ribosome-binding factor RbfA [Pseudomonadota bacterium]
MGGQRGNSGPGQSQRQLRVGEALRHVLSDLLMRGAVHDPLLAEAHLTVSEVRMSRDLRHAVAFVSELGGEVRDELLEALGRAAPFLRGEAARRIHLKYAPNLSFQADSSFAEAARIEGLLASERATLARVREDDDGSG